LVSSPVLANGAHAAQRLRRLWNVFRKIPQRWQATVTFPHCAAVSN